MPKTQKQANRESDARRRAQDTICRRISAGEALPSICRDDDMPAVATVLEWLEDGRRSSFRDRVRQAQAVRREVFAEQILAIADGVVEDGDADEDGNPPSLDRDQLQLAKLRIDARKWLMARTDSVSTAPAEASAAGLWRELLKALDGRHRGLPAGGETFPPPAGPLLSGAEVEEAELPEDEQGDC